jgi:ParB family chromosome partitioning protein
MQLSGNAERASVFVRSDPFRVCPEGERFNLLLAELKIAKKPKRANASPSVQQFHVAAKAVAVTTRASGKTFTLSLTSKDASKFGSFVSDQLEALYQAFQDHEQAKAGD